MTLARYALTRATEAGTWRGIMLGLGLFGLRTSDPWWQHFCDFGMFAAGLIQGALPELASPVTVRVPAASSLLDPLPIPPKP